MSETETTYGVPKTVCDTEPFPPQTGDLLGSYIARLSARVKALETAYTEPSAYQRSLEARIERLESLIERLMARMDVLGHLVSDHIKFGCDRNSCPRLEPTEEPAATTPTRERTHGRYGTRNLTKSAPDHEDTIRLCKYCLHGEPSHTLHKEADGTVIGWSCCAPKLGLNEVTGMTTVDKCECTEFSPQPEPTAEPVCATCGHDHGAHDVVGPCLVVGCRCSSFKASPAD